MTLYPNPNPGETHQKWWYWVLKGHVAERAYTHHTWFLYLLSDDCHSHFPIYRSYEENRCLSDPWPP